MRNKNHSVFYKQKGDQDDSLSSASSDLASSVDADDEEETGYKKNCDFKLPGWADSGEIILFNPSETKDSDEKEIKIDDDNTNG